MSDPLYKPALLRLAADATGAGRLSVPCATATAFNPVCGDKVTVDVALDDGRIATIAHDTKACVLTQASAAIMGAEIAGLSRAEVSVLHGAVSAMLSGAEPPLAPFDAFAVFDGVAEHRNRHRCVLLPIEALLAALDASESREVGRKRS
ncbi:MAG TPA: iron-sulfur cluster assembly scaffold protein [Rhizomicrobium sp.]|jgi:nitrogen fixation NifU-like protein